MLDIAVIGLGWWGRIIVDLVRGSDKLRVVRVADVDPKAAGFAQERGLPCSTRFEDVLADPAVQAVVLCTPHTQHTDQIVAAAAAGKHVFCEKPLSMTRADVLRAIQAVEKAGVALAVGHEKRFEPPILELMRLLRSGALGTPLQVEANFSQDKFLALADDNWRLSGKEAPAGPMTATGIHLLDLSIGVFGEAETAYCSVRQLGSKLRNGDTLAALVTFRRGGHALITAILATPFAGRFAVYGSQGWAEVRDKTHP
ncbi:MAG TPA: Gfo/Idh/MocA family oxidoreductase, partial [Ramlibacter sp.]|nr:Gfo/Idh/MocA family oxidoreductase [Ramlibacter sp.]